MRRMGSSLRLTVIVLCVLLLATLAWSQKQNANIGPKYDLTTETKFKGVIDDVQNDSRPGEGLHLLLRSGTDAMLAHIAPEFFLKDLDISFAKGDVVQVVGSQIKNQQTGEPEILVKEITRNNNTFTLRDNKGVPVWSGWVPPKKEE